MNSFVLTIFFVGRCFGQLNIPTVPNGTLGTLGTLPNGTQGTSGTLPGTLGTGSPIAGLPAISNLPSMPAIPISSGPGVLERPCRPSDLPCIRRYFLQNSECKKAPGRVPDPLVRAISSEFYTNVNITKTDVNARYNNLNGKIREFYINRQTDKLVLGIELQDLQKSSNNAFLRYHRRGREPIITHGFASAVFRSVYLTVIIPQVDNLRLDKSDSYAFVAVLPSIVLAPSLGQSSDPSIPLKLAAFVANLPIDVAEYMLTESSFVAATLIQYVICDFGLKLI